jgi:hypothetical protein
MTYYIKQAQQLAKLALKQNDPLLWDLAKCNLIKAFELKQGAHN